MYQNKKKDLFTYFDKLEALTQLKAHKKGERMYHAEYIMYTNELFIGKRIVNDYNIQLIDCMLHFIYYFTQLDH
jgi:hypothetical protein